jgi:uncharacterized membrane protein
MAKVSKSVRIETPVERVYQYLNDPQNLPEIWPSLMEVSNVEAKPDGRHSYDWVYKMAGLNFKGHSDTSELEAGKHVVIKNEKGIPSTFDWRYESDGAGTKVTLAVDYTLPNKLLDKLAAPFIERLNEQEAETLLKNAKARLELGEKTGAQKPAAQPVRH